MTSEGQSVEMYNESFCSASEQADNSQPKITGWLKVPQHKSLQTSIKMHSDSESDEETDVMKNDELESNVNNIWEEIGEIEAREDVIKKRLDRLEHFVQRNVVALEEFKPQLAQKAQIKSNRTLKNESFNYECLSCSKICKNIKKAFLIGIFSLAILSVIIFALFNIALIITKLYNYFH